MPARLLSLEEFLEIAVDVFDGQPREELATEQVMHVAKLALDAPGAEVRGKELYPGLAGKAAVMCRALLARPPFSTERGCVAWRCLERLLQLNDGFWPTGAQETILRFDEAARDPRQVDDVIGWIGGSVRESGPVGRPGGRTRRRTEQQSLFDAMAPREAVVVHLAGPLISLVSRERQRLRQLNRQVNHGLLSAQRTFTHPVALRLEHPCLESSHRDEDVIDMWERVSGEVVDTADALILTDVDEKPLGFGAACELMLFTRHEGPILYLQSERCEKRSRFLEGLARDLDVEVARYAKPTEIRGLVSEWIARRVNAIESAARKRKDRELQYAPLQRRIAARWRDLNQRQRRVAIGLSGLLRPSIDRMTTSVAYLASVPTHQVDALCRALNVPREDGAALDVPNPRDRVNWEALLQLMEERKLSSACVIDARNRAMLERGGPQYAARRRLSSMADWAKLVGELER